VQNVIKILFWVTFVLTFFCNKERWKKNKKRCCIYGSMWCERILRHVVWLWWWRNHLLTVGVNVPTDVRPVNNQSCRNNRRPSPVSAMKTHQRLFTVCVSYKLVFSLVLFVRLVTYLRILPSLDRHAHLPTAYPETQLVIVFWHILFPTTLVSRWSNRSGAWLSVCR